MKSLTLCQSCKRHVKVVEVRCPFCAAAVAPPSVERAQSPRGRPGGRAALFFAGAALAPGCAEESAVPVYGIPIDLDGAVVGRRDAGEQQVVPVYGIPVDASVKDGGPADAGCGLPPPRGNLPVPVYGIPVDSGAQVDICQDAGSDAGRDAGQPLFVPPYGIAVDPRRELDAGSDAGYLGVPVYGITIDDTRDPSPPVAVAPRRNSGGGSEG